MSDPITSHTEHLAAELAWLNALIGAQLASAQADTAIDPLRGMYVSDAEVSRLLQVAGRMERPAENATARRLRDAIEANAADDLPLVRTARAFGLSAVERQLLVLALAPEADPAYERIIAYLHDDFARRRPSAGLALRLLDASREAILAALAPDAPLLRLGLLKPLEGDAPLLGRPLVPDLAVIGFALRGEAFEPRLSHPAAGRLKSLRWDGQFDALLPMVATPGKLLHLEGPPGTGRRTLAEALCGEMGVPMLVADLGGLDPASLASALAAAFRSAKLLEANLYLASADLLVDPEMTQLRSTLATLSAQFGTTTFVATERAWPAGGRQVIPVRLPEPGRAARQELWAQFAGEAGLADAAIEWADVAARFRFTPGAMQSALRTARDLSLLRQPAGVVGETELTEACYMQSSSRLGSLAKPVAARRGWSDLTLPANARAQLGELCAQVRQRRRVFDDWGFGRVAARSLCALFYGPSGAGKTMAAEVIASELRLRLYKIDLSLVVSKYIGETEKNLSRVFEEAETSNAILFFDEADALFGKRSEVKDAHDRYANIETNYLLQRIEEFDGLVILASNLRKNIDDGFFRRMQVTVEFPMPDAEHRYRIWRQHVPTQAEVSTDVDFSFLAERFPMAGGNIRNIVLNAAFLAAEQQRAIGMEHLVRATRREYDKIGLAFTRADFAPYNATTGQR